MSRSKLLQHMVVLLSFALLSASPALALSFNDVIIEGVVGSGANESMIVIDWDSGLTESHAWLFLWDTAATFQDAYNAIEAAEGGAFSWSNTSFVDFMDYTDDDGDVHITGAPGWLSFWESSDGETWATTSTGVFDSALSDGSWAGANANLPSGTWPGSAPTVPVPEPGTALLVGLGLVVLAGRSRLSDAA